MIAHKNEQCCTNGQTRRLLCKKKTSEILANHTGKSVQNIMEDIDRDFFLSPEEAKSYGIVDEVVGSVKQSKVA